MRQMTNYTSGPWRIKYQLPRVLPVTIEAPESVVCVTNTYDDARLIAAAPELLEAVQELLYYAREACDNAGGPEETRGRAPRIWREIQEAEALIRRVNGEEQPS